MTGSRVQRPSRPRPARAAGATALCGLLAAGLLAPAAASAAPSAAAGDPSAIQAGLERLIADEGLPAALATVRDAGGAEHDLTAGVGDLATGGTVPVDGQVRVGSNTKTFLATVVLQLAGEGLVQLDDPVERHLPGLLRGEGVDGNAITVRQLLQHTSGLPEFTDLLEDELAVDELDRFHEPHQLLTLALSRPATFPPGTSWSYSNTNYVVAGLLVQQVTGRPVEEVVTRRVIEPLHLADTYWPAEGELSLRDDHPHGYFAAAHGDPWVDVTDLDSSLAWAAGALVSTPGDLLTFTTALLGGELLAPGQLAEMQTTVPVPGAPAGAGYGLGLLTRPLSCGVAAWGHGGDIPGYTTRGAVTTDGRGVMLAVTGTPTALEQYDAIESVVDAALCD